MEIRKLFRRKLLDQTGASFFIWMLVLTALILLALGAMEYLRVVNLYEGVRTELERAGNIAVEYAMIDEARGYHISEIDPEVAEQQFSLCFTERLGLTESLEKTDGEGNSVYTVIFDSFVIDSEEPSIRMRGRIRIPLQLIEKYMTVPVTLRFYVDSKNVNAVD